MVWIWTAVFIVSIVVEIVTVELASIWFTFGSFVAFILALCHVNESIQIIVFLVSSVLLFIGLRPLLVKLLKNNKEKTNVDSLVGTVHTLQKEIGQEEAGEIKLNGVVWRAVSEENENIAAGEKVQIVAVKGNKLIVKSAKGEKKDE